MKLFRNKFVIGGLCILLGLTAALLIPARAPITGSLSGSTVTVLRLKQDVAKGAEITAPLVESVQADRNDVPKDAITSLDSIPGRYAVTPLFVGDYLTPAKLTAQLTSADFMPACTAKGLKVVTVTIPSFAAGLAGRLQPGDVITIVALPNTTGSISQSLGTAAQPQEEASPLPIIYPELKYVEVCSVTAADGTDAHVSGALTGDEKNSLPIAVSLFVSDAQALRLIELDKQDCMHFVLVARAADAAKFIPDNVLIPINGEGLK